MERVASAYQVETFHVYVLTNAIFAEGVEGGSQHSVELRHIPGTTTHLGRICAVNQLSREIAQGQHTVEEAFQILEKIQKTPYSPCPWPPPPAPWAAPLSATCLGATPSMPSPPCSAACC